MFTRNRVIMSHNIKTPLTSISRAVGNILQLKDDQLIKSLFANNEQGFFYDPNDLSTMFQDSAGTIPVTAAGQPVGLVLDKSGRGNHATQSTSASRPILQQTPILGNELLVNGDFATNDFTGWAHPDSAPSATTVANQQVTMTAGAGSTLARLRQSLPVTAGEYVVSLDVKSITGTPQLYLSMGNTASGDATYGTITCNRLGKYEQKITVAAGTLGLAFTTSSINGGSIVIDDISVKRVTSYRTDQNYLAFDGVDDFLQTNNIDFTATDEVSLFAGLVKNTSGTIGSIFEFSSNPLNNSGTFGAYTDINVSMRGYTVYSRGTVAVAASIQTSSMKASLVLMADISQDKITAQVNGVTSTTRLDQGTGNYGNYPLYIGRRGGAILPFNGHLYSLIGIGRLTTDSETLAIEKELAKRAGVTL